MLAAFLLPAGSAGTALDGLNKGKSRKTAVLPQTGVRIAGKRHKDGTTITPYQQALQQVLLPQPYSEETGAPSRSPAGRDASLPNMPRRPPALPCPPSSKTGKTLPPLPGNAPVREQIILPYPP
ncbi:hypothetical protein DMI72_02145 [Akkermansia muciniphila]|nr:hypothetical protein DMI71_02095 [Akkermansia muciniphila]QHV55100.1 hypothetical protein DMI72_02145 [Akkermansia muciniphila]QHV57475.1 hypothetical protein DMI73_02105 [Akkermansia muciniphila]